MVQVDHDALVVVPGATKVQYRDDYDGSVSYLVTVPYPAESVIAFIRNSLEERGWKPLDEDIYNPEMPTSEIIGWTEFVKSGATVHAWQAEWQKPDGAVVLYSVRYEPHSGEREETSIALVNAIFLSPISAAAVKKRAAERVQGQSPSSSGVSFLILSSGQKVAVLRTSTLQHPSTLVLEYLTHVPLTDRCTLQQEVGAVWEVVQKRADISEFTKVTILARPARSASLPEYFFYEQRDTKWVAASGFRPGC